MLQNKRKCLFFSLVLFICSLSTFVHSAQLIPENPSFDNGLNGWVIPGAATIDYDAKQGKGSPGSLKIVGGPSKSFAYQIGVPVEPDTMYELRAWVKGEKGLDIDAALKLEWYTDRGINTSGKYGHLLTKGSDEWQLIRLIGKSDKDTSKVSIYLRVYGTGTVWFDDVVLREFNEGFMLEKRLMGIESSESVIHPVSLRIFNSENQYNNLVIKLKKDSFNKEWSVENPTIKEIVDQPDAKLYTWHVPFSKLAPGIYDMTLKMPEIDPDYEEQAVLKVAIENRKPKNLSETGNFIVNGKPFFPIGLYHVSPEKYSLIAEYGFNAVQGTPTYDSNVVRNNLMLAQKAGIMVDQGLYYRGSIKERFEYYKAAIRKNKNHPNLLNWKIIDEPNKRGDKMIPEVFEAYAEYKKIDPDTPILLTIGPEMYVYEMWAKSCDIFQVDPYPIPEFPLTMVSDHVTAAKEVLQPWQNLTDVLQAGWLPGPTPDQPLNQPTKEQARSMVYLALINGAKGIFWYSMEDPGWDLTLTPLWKDFKAINQETAWLGDIVMNGEPIDCLANKKGDLQYAGWRYEDNIYVFATNSDDNVGLLEFCLPAVNKFVEQKFDITKPCFTGYLLNDELPPLTSTVYIFEVN